MILGAIPGATPDKWVQRWRQRYPGYALEVQYYDDAGQLTRISNGTVDLGYLRFREGEDPTDKDQYHRVVLYQELAVVCAAADHWIAAAEESVSSEELAEESFLEPQDFAEVGVEVASAERMALEVAASGAGVVVLPNSVARMLSRKDVVIRSIEDARGYDTGLVWRRGHEQEELIQEFIGIARGRKASSGRSQLPAKKKAKPAAARSETRSRSSNSPRRRRR